MNRPVPRFLTVMLVIVGFVAASSVLTALITSRRTDGAWKFAISLQCMATLFGPPFLLLLFCRITKSRLRRADRFAALAAVIAAVPLSLLIFNRVVPVVAGVPFSREASRLLTAGLLGSTIGIIYLAKKIPDNVGTRRSCGRR